MVSEAPGNCVVDRDSSVALSRCISYPDYLPTYVNLDGHPLYRHGYAVYNPTLGGVPPKTTLVGAVGDFVCQLADNRVGDVWTVVSTGNMV